MERRSLQRILAIIAAVGLLVVGCGDPDEDDDGGAADGGTNGGAAADFQACQVTDTGGVDDRSFNQTAYDGVVRAADELGVQESVLESQSEADFESNIQTFIDQGCDMIVTVGFLLGPATQAAAEANPDQQFAIVDFDFFDQDSGDDITLDNVRELTFATDEAAFLAGYLAAGMTQTNKVGMYGGLEIPTVTIFMDGFQAGVDYYNQQKGTSVEAVGRNLFTGSFEDQTTGRATTEQLLDEGADIIMPVAGPVGLGSIEAIRARGNTARLIWVDTDGCISVEAACDLFLSSVEKKMDNAVFDTVQSAVNGEFEGGLYSGTLENDGVGIAPFHEFEGQVDPALAAEIEDLQAQIIAGEIETSPGG
ncbi:MAG: BMP family lipoprotein [Acidimicrobiales bacterium]